MISPEFLVSSLVVVPVPGTGSVYTVSTGLALVERALRHGFAAAFVVLGARLAASER